jgi:replicative DNA helicase
VTQSAPDPDGYTYREPEPAEASSPPPAIPAPTPATTYRRRAPASVTTTQPARRQQTPKPPQLPPAREPEHVNGHATTARPQPFEPATRPIPFGHHSESVTLLDRLPPHNLSAEAGVLGSIIIDPDVMDGVKLFIRDEHAFFKEEHQTIYRVLGDLHAAGKPIDAMILFSTLKNQNILDQIGGIEYIKELANAVPISAHAEYYAGLVAEDARLRTVISASSRAIRRAYDHESNAEEICNTTVAEIEATATVSANAFMTSAEMMHATFERQERISKGDWGLPFPFFGIQEKTMGMHGGELIYVAGRPGTGKSALAQAIIENLAIDLPVSEPVAVFSLEMSKEDWGMRMLCSRASIPLNKWRRGLLTKEELSEMHRALGDISRASIFINDRPGLTPSRLRSELKRLKKHHGVRMAVIDYLQLMEPGKKCSSREQEVAYISGQCKNLARELDMPLMMLAQLNRESEKDKRRPRQSDLRESGAIEQDADLLMLLHREWKLYEGDAEWQQHNWEKEHLAEVIIAKQRNGECGVHKVCFYGPTTSYMDLDTARRRGINV